MRTYPWLCGARRHRLRRDGFTLVELMVVVAIVGVLAALAIYGVRNYVAAAKTSEAQTAVGKIAQDATGAYLREGMRADVLGFGATAAVNNRLCASSTNVPDSAVKIKGQKYQSSPTEWASGDQFTGWTCLRFSMQDPQYYMYGYSVTGTGAVGDEFVASAEGDLNGDDRLSRFELRGKVQKASTGPPIVTLAPNISATNPDD